MKTPSCTAATQKLIKITTPYKDWQTLFNVVAWEYKLSLSKYPYSVALDLLLKVFVHAVNPVLEGLIDVTF